MTLKAFQIMMMTFLISTIVAFLVAAGIHLMVTILHAFSRRKNKVDNAKEIEAALAVAIAKQVLKK